MSFSSRFARASVARGFSAAVLALATVAVPYAVSRADSTAQGLPFSQDWTNNGLITVNDDWSGVPGIVGHLGDYTSSSPTNVDPQTLLDDMTGTAVDVIANQTNPNGLATGGVAEFHLVNPTIALNGSGTADAPFLLLNLVTTGDAGVRVSYNLRDLDASVDNAVQQVALHYRVGSSGPFTNLPAGYVPDATTGPSLATLVTAVSVELPADANDQPLVQVRVITTNAAGNDEWVGIDDISVAVTGDPTGVGAADPASVQAGDSSRLTVAVTPGTTPPSTGITVDGDLTPIGGVSTQPFFDDGSNGDVTAGDGVYSYLATVAAGTTAGPKTLAATVADAEGRSSTANISLTIVPPPPPFVAIHAIQGTGTSSPHAGETLRTSGIVTGHKTNGFFLQTADGADDGDPASSQGVFVFTSSPPPAAAAVGNSVEVTGTVAEFVPGADPFQPPLTELTFATVTFLSGGNPLPTPVVLTASDTSPTGTLEQLERFEGMRVQVHSLTVVAPTTGFVNEPTDTGGSNGVFQGVITGVARPFREAGHPSLDPLPAGAPCCVPRFDENPERLRVDSDGLVGAAQLNVSAGAVLGPIVGPLDFGFRTYTILPDPGTAPAVPAVSVTPVSAPGADQFTVGSANLQRFFDTVNDAGTDDPVVTAAAFEKRLGKASLFVRDVLRYPDILGVVEVENLTTLQTLATRINSDAGAANPNYVAYLEEGNDIGGIDSGFLVKSARVSVLEVTQEGKDATFVNPTTGANDLLNDRPPLVLEAEVTSGPGAVFPVTVIVNHLRSLNDVADPVAGPRVRAKRAAQAEFLANLIQERQAADHDEPIISVGDYNAFQISDGLVDSIGTIKGTPTDADHVVTSSPDLVTPDLVNLVDTVPADQRYSYVFDGNAQVLDHVIVTANLVPLVDKLQYSRGNADSPETARNAADSAARLSDHDAPVAYFNFPVPQATQTTVTSAPNPSAFGTAVTFTATVQSGGGPVTQGTVTFTDGDVPLFGPATPDAAGQVTFVTSGLGVGAHLVTATYSGQSGTHPLEPSSGHVTHLVQPGLSIDDVTVGEGTFAIPSATFTVTLSPASDQPVTVTFATADGTATAWRDYIGRPPTTLTFPAGVTTRTIRVSILGDFFHEADETFFVNLSNSAGAVIVDGQGAGTIVDDDPAPRIHITDTVVLEGNTGTNSAIFLLRLSAPSGRPVTVDFTTADGTAAAPGDYAATSGTVVFAPGTLFKIVVVPVHGDTAREADETFFVDLANPTGGTLADARARATIFNDDRRR